LEYGATITLYAQDRPLLLEKRIALLKAIKKNGSILKAAKDVPLSYKAAWEAIDEMNNLSHTPLVVKEAGGKGGGGTKLTKYGERLLKNYEVLKSEQKRFLESLSRVADIDQGDLTTLQRIAMELSARNQLSGTITSLIKGKVAAEVDIELKSGNVIVSSITKHGVESLGLSEGMSVVAIFKATSVLIGRGDGLEISARNKIEGEVVEVTHGEVNCEVIIDIGGGEKLSSIITDKAAKNLELKKGSKVVAIIKSTEILVGK